MLIYPDIGRHKTNILDARGMAGVIIETASSKQQLIASLFAICRFRNTSMEENAPINMQLK